MLTFAEVLSVDINSALMSDIEDFEDSVVDAVAERSGAELITTFQGAGTRVVTPGAYIQG